MKKLRLKQFCIIQFSLLILLLSGCKKDSNNSTTPPLTPVYFTKGVFIINQGNYETGSGTVSFFNRSDKTIKQDIFNAVNDRPLGNVVQSMTIFHNNAYIVVNNSGKIEVANDSTFKSTGTITGLFQPRYFMGISPLKAYVSQWIDGSSVGNLAVINLTDNTISKTIAVGHGPEQMLQYKSKAFVINTGGYGVDSTISVINTQTDVKVGEINISHIPSGICLDINNKLWVLCSGGINGWVQTNDTYGHLLRIDPDNNQIEKDFTFPSLTIHPVNLLINTSQDYLFYVYSNNIYKFNISDSSIPTAPFITLNYFPYTLGYDYATNYLYAANTLTNDQNGYFYRYDPVTGAQVDFYKVGVIPGNFCFN